MIDTFIEFAIMHFVFVVSPGASFVYLIGNGLRLGIKIAIFTLIGTTIGYGLIAALSVLGAIEVLETFPALGNIIKIAGGSYLLYKAYKIWNGAANMNEAEFSDSHANGKTPKYLLKEGFKVSITNPQIGINMLALLACFSGYNVEILQRIGIWAWLTVGYFLYFYIMLKFFTNGYIRKIIMPQMKIVERTLAVILAIFSVKMML